MRIITVSREFSSGGREVAKRLADVLGFKYYDREIITGIAEQCGESENFIRHTLRNSSEISTPITFGNSFSINLPQLMRTDILVSQKNVIEELAKQGEDFIMVGRNSDILLREYNPLNIFICANKEAKIQRCIDRAPEGEKLTRKEIEKKMAKIDKSRKRTRAMIADGEWGERHQYNLIVNTTGWDMKELSIVLGDFCKSWFDRNNK